MKSQYDLVNMLCMFDESIDKLVKHLEQGYPDRALMRAKDMQRVIFKLKKHLGATFNNGVERKL